MDRARRKYKAMRPPALGGTLPNRLAHETVPTCFSTPTIPWTGIPGTSRRSDWPAARTAHLPQHRLLGVPLVPCDGA